MKPIKDYDLINEAGEYKRIPAGIYAVKITNVVDNPQNEYLEIYSDVVKGEYTGYFKSLVDAGMQDTSRHFRSYKTKAIPFFKAFITAVEKSNPGYKWDWDEKKLIGKFVVAVFGDEEYLDKDGNVKVSTRIVEFRSVDAWKEGKIKVPELKKLPANQVPVIESQAVPANGTDDSFFELSDDELPF